LQPAAQNPEADQDFMSADACPYCHARLPANSPGGLCPACLWAGLSDDDGADTSDTLPVGGGAAAGAPVQGLWALPGLTLLSELGRGGMGLVYRARQASPARDVALKMLLPHQLNAPGMRQRFELEVRANAALEHPSILPVYEVGEIDGQPFYTMKLAGGGNLAERRDPLSGRWREIATLVADLAEAVHFAHVRGVLHRDIKPGNILFDEADRPFLSDFGLAKFFTESETTAFTRTLNTLGTPHYLAPEVAAGGGRAATTASDTYALGAVLYELLAGQPPFVAPTIPALLHAITDTDPPVPQKPAAESRRPQSPRDLGIVALKCLRKDPADRYRTAADMAADLRRWLAGEPVHARPITPRERLHAWVRKNPALAAVSALLVIAVIVAVGRQTISNRQLRIALGQSILNQVQLNRGSGHAGQRHGSLALVTRAAGVTRGGWLYPAMWRTETVAALARPDLRQLAHWSTEGSALAGMDAFSPDLAQYAIGDGSGGFRILDTATHAVIRHFPGGSNRLPLAFRFRPGHPEIVVSFSDGPNEVWSIATGALLARSGGGHRPQIDFGPDGTHFIAGSSQPRPWPAIPAHHIEDISSGPIAFARLAPTLDRVAGFTAEGRLAIWNAGAAVPSVVMPDEAVESDSLAWSPDGQLLAFASGRTPVSVTLVRAADGAIRARFQDHDQAVSLIAFLPDGHSLLTAGLDGRLVWRSVEAGGWTLQIPAAPRALVVSPDGRRVGYSPRPGELGLLEVQPVEVLQAWPAPPGDCNCAFNLQAAAHTNLLLTTARDGVRLWDTRTRRLLDTFATPPDKPHLWINAFFADQDREIVVSGFGWGVFRAPLERSADGPRFGRAERLVDATHFVLQHVAPDGRSLVLGRPPGSMNEAGAGTEAWLWPDGQSSRARLLARGDIGGFRLLADGQTGVSTHLARPGLRRWDTQQGSQIGGLDISLPVISAESRDGRWLATVSTAGTKLWEISSWHEVAIWNGDNAEVVPTFSPDHRMVATVNRRGEIVLRRVPEGTEILTLVPTEPLRPRDMAFSPDSQSLWLLLASGRIREWRLDLAQRELGTFGLNW
jgi:eukaryotic-like serine/threonine-protein kinase